MIVLRHLRPIGCRACQLAHCSTNTSGTSSNITTNYLGVALHPKFSFEVQEKVLNVLNKSNAEQLSRFAVSQARIKNLEMWKMKKGPFKSLADVLEVDGLGVKVLERLCESILISEKQQDDENAQLKINNVKNHRKQYTTPNLEVDKIFSLQSAVGLYLRPAGISWTKISKDDNCVCDWGFHDFSTFPKKMLPTDTFQLAMTILNNIPVSDVYVFEAPQNGGMQSTKQPATVAFYNNQLELMSMLLALINTSSKHSSQIIREEDEKGGIYTNNIYYLRANLSARLFRTLMGSECVSSTKSVTTILNEARNDVQHDLPCSSIEMRDNLINQYECQSSVVKEIMGQSLMLTIAFMELCVYKNMEAIQAISPRRKNSLM